MLCHRDGAAVPDGTSAIVRRENGELTDGQLTAAHVPGADIRPAGEECRRGEVLAQSGELVGPALIGLLSAAGIDTVAVRPRPRVAIVLFGDELVDSGVAGIGQVRDSLGPQLPGWIKRMGPKWSRSAGLRTRWPTTSIGSGRRRRPPTS